MSQPFLGSISMFAGNFAPRGYAFCNGQLLSVAQNSALFSLLGTTYGGNGQTTFGVPDLRGRSPVHPGQGQGLSNITLGQVAGAESVTLLSAQMPAHTHPASVTGTINVANSAGNKRLPAGNTLAGDVSGDQMYTDGAPDSALNTASLTATATVGASGGSQPVAIRSPFVGINFIIATEGLFPSRN